MDAEIKSIAQRAQRASQALLSLDAPKKINLLNAMADSLMRNQSSIMAANKNDVDAAGNKGISAALLDRLTLTERRFAEMVQSLREVARLPSPVGELIEERTRPNGLVLKKIRVPIGVIGMVYEARPNVSCEVVGLCMMSSNAVILRGGSESLQSNMAIVAALSAGWLENGGPRDAFLLIENTNRESVTELVKQKGLVDLVILRGGEGLINAATEAAEVPLIEHGKGVCHIYVHEDADLAKALPIIDNAKCQRPSVCNALETLLIHKNIAPKLLPSLFVLMQDRGVALRGCERTREILPEIAAASEEDWSTEYLDLILAIRIVDDLDTAIEHINYYGSHHSDAILTKDESAAERFLNLVNSAVVYANASTRFTDGGQFGMGAEIGISTNKLHARGPMGLEELTTYKWIVRGAGQIRS